MAILTVDWECWNSFDHHSKWNAHDSIDEPTHYLLDLLSRHNIKAIFYCVGWLENQRKDLVSLIESKGHVIGDHTYYHSMNPKITAEKTRPFRAPRWEDEKRLYSGGFWFRLMPYWWTKREVEKTGIFFIHLHDLLFNHPKCGFRNFDRNIGLKNSRDKLERLCREVKWDEPR